eukprot:TRINITY_DN5497_c0_g3_i8.p1 TRINITY_DN5497_c0_g3~~TRINITY_DN5497_c0_g3_i8.p1  ORF type:complete len:148 (-),score=25.11 TRINITY_DN5497_c0_g3_i8:41-484(-)
MKECAAGVCVAFLLLIHFTMMIVSIYKHTESTTQTKLYPIILFIISSFGFINDLTFTIALCWPSKLIYSCIVSYNSALAWTYLLSHGSTAVYLWHLAGNERGYKESVELYIYIIYIVAGGAIFYATFKLIKGVIKDSKKPKKKPHLD